MSEPTQRSDPTGSAIDAVDWSEAPAATTTIRHLIRRELSTAFRLRVYVGLWVGFVGLLSAIGWFGGGVQTGYVSTIIDLLTPLEILIPILAFAFGYRSIVDDKQRGVLDVLRTYPVPSWRIAVGVYLGRAIGLVTVISTGLLFLMFPIAVAGSSRPVFYATHVGADSPGLFLRFIVLTTAFALVVLAASIAVSALVSTSRTAIVAAAVVLLLFLFFADIALVFGLSRGLFDEVSLAESLALSPLSAYRGLVLETTVAGTVKTSPQAASPLISLIGLCVWGAGSLAIAAVAIRR